MPRHYWMCVVALCLSAIVGLFVANPGRHGISRRDARLVARTADLYQGKPVMNRRVIPRAFSFPATFEPISVTGPNAAQFVARGTNVELAVTNTGIELAARPSAKGRASVASMQFLAAGTLVANGSLRWHGVDRLRGETNYLLGNDRAKWRTHVPHYARVETSAGRIGIAVYARGRDVEYDLRVPPGVDASQIRLAVSGARIRLAKNGSLSMQIGAAEFQMDRPVAYEETASPSADSSTASGNTMEPRVAVRSKFGTPRLKAAYVLEADGTVGFRIMRHNPRATLVIDPTISLVYSSFLGGVGREVANSVAADSSGKIYIAGTTTSPATFSETTTAQVGPGLPANTGSDSAAREFFVAKIDPTQTDANSLVYLTFLGGSTDQAGGLIAVDSADNVAITGTTSSTDFPVTDSSSRTAGANDTIVSEIGPTGSNLLYSTMFGGSGAESQQSAGGIALDASGNIFVASDTNSPDLPVTAGAYATASAYVGPSAGDDGFLAVFQPGTMPVFTYCTYLGVNGTTGVGGIAVDASGNAYIAGFTNDANANFPFTNAMQPFFGGAFDAFLMKIAPAGQGTQDLRYATLLGGNNSDKAFAVAVDSASPPNAYVTGTTGSTNFPTNGTVAAYQATLPSNATSATSDAFVSVISQSATTGMTALAYSTYFGGSQADAGYAIEAAEPYGVYVTGTANSWDFPWHDNFQPFNGFGDAFVAKLDTTTGGALGLVYSTPLGGTSPAGETAGSQATGIAVVPPNTAGCLPSDGISDCVWVAGQTTSADFASAGNPGNGLQKICGSCEQPPAAADAFVAEIQENTAQHFPSLYFAGPGIPLNFGNALVGTTNIPLQFAAVKNGGEATLNVSSIGISGPNQADFSLSNSNCSGAAIAPGGLCSFEVGFVPSIAGAEEAFVQVASDAPGSPQVLELIGTGGGLSIAPAKLDFGSQMVGTISAAQAVTLTNTASEPTLYIDAISEAGTDVGMFEPANTAQSCRTGFVPMPSGSTCSVPITFGPTTTGSFSADLDIQYHFEGLSEQEQLIPLDGTGTAAVPTVILLPPTLAFGSLTVGQNSGTQIVTLSNSGNAPLGLTSINVTGTNAPDFAIVSAGSAPCASAGGTVAVNESCTVGVQFAPQTAGEKSATLSFADNAGDSPQAVPLTGTAQSPAAIQITPTAVTFGSQAVGTKSPAQQVTIANNGGTALSVNAISTAGSDAADFLETNNCPPSLGANTSCLVSVLFQPTAPGTRTASLSISDSGAGSPQQIGLTGTATQAAVTLSSASVNFGNQPVGTTSAALSVTVTNSGNGPLIISGISLAGTNADEFGETDDCTGSSGIAPAGTCAIQIAFKPACGPIGSATRTATVALTDNAPGSPQIVTLTGTGTGPFCFIVPAGGSTSASVSPGQTATIALQMEAANAFSGNVTLACAGAPANASCAIAPATLNIGGSEVAGLQVNVATSAGPAALVLPDTQPPNGAPRGSFPAFGWAVLLAIIASIGMARTQHGNEGRTVGLRQIGRLRLRRVIALAGVSFAMAAVLAACGGGASSAPASAPADPATPAGTYVLTVTGTTNTGGAESISLTLTVR